MSSYPTDDSVPPIPPIPGERRPTTPIFDETVETTALPVSADGGDRGSTKDRVAGQAQETAGQAKQTAQETAGVVGEQAGQVAGAAKDAGQRVAGTTKEQASRVATDALGQARELYGQATTELSNQASQQQTRAASTLRTVGQDLSDMGANQDGGLAAELVQNLSRRASRAAEWLEQREPAEVLDEVKRFAARRPGLFIALAATAGVVGARLTKALVAEAKPDVPSGRSTGATGTDAYPGYSAPRAPETDLVDSTYVVPDAGFPDAPPVGGTGYDTGYGTTGGVR